MGTNSSLLDQIGCQAVDAEDKLLSFRRLIPQSGIDILPHIVVRPDATHSVTGTFSRSICGMMWRFDNCSAIIREGVLLDFAHGLVLEFTSAMGKFAADMRGIAGKLAGCQSLLKTYPTNPDQKSDLYKQSSPNYLPILPAPCIIISVPL